VSDKNHCIWILDERLQVWKCSNEINPTSTNWTLTKITVFDNLYFKRFLKPAMTYDDFFVTTSLNGIRCLKQIGFDNFKQREFLFAFNKSSTKGVIVKQPLIMS